MSWYSELSRPYKNLDLVVEMARPLYEEVADHLREGINDGTYPPGSALPSEPALVTTYGTARGTVRRALQLLAQEGLIVSSQGRGHVVRAWEPLWWTLTSWERKHEAAGPGLDAWESDVAQQSRKPGQRVSVSIVLPPDTVRERLELPADQTTVVLRSRIRTVDGQPWQISDSYFPHHIADDTILMTPENTSAPGGLLAAIGHVQVRYRDEIGTRMPTPRERETLQLGTGTPVATHIRTGYNADDQPLRVMLTICPGDRHVLVYEITA